MTNYVHKLMKDAVDAGFELLVLWDGEVGYSGMNVSKANAAVNAVEEACVCIIDTKDPNPDMPQGKSVGFAHIVNGLDEDERISNTGHLDWCDRWTTANIR